MKPLRAAAIIPVLFLVAFPLVSHPLSAQESRSGAEVPAYAVNGTTGAPLGGFGAGAVKFDANTGTFAAMLRPPADAYDFERLKHAGFALFTQRAGKVATVGTLKARQADGTPDDDAIWPLHRVNFGSTAGIAVRMTAFAPFDRRDPGRMSLPYAFYEFTLVNEGATAAEAALALRLDVGDAAVHAVPGKGFRSRAWSVYAAAEGKPAVISAGGEAGFLARGLASDEGAGGVTGTAVKVPLAAGETRRVRFVLAWYEDSDPERSWYLGQHRDSSTVADAGLAHFGALRANAAELVDRMRASNLPDWLKNQTLNTLVNLSTNSMYKKDGRVAFAEGQWTCFGTMDQMWHARQIMGQLLPFFAWEELKYWARTQMKNGQIHHDTNKMDVGADRALRSVMVDWDDTEHADYRDIARWVDLNAGFIVSAYETYEATGDRAQFEAIWPNVKRAAQRILDQVELYGSKQYPYTFDHSENSYDAGGDPNPFNASLSAVAYKLMTRLATEQGEAALAARYQTAYDTVVASFRARYLNEAGFRLGKHSEGYFGGQWLALTMKLGEIWPAADHDFVLARLNDYYQPYYRGLGYADGTYDEWTPYIVTHYGGLLLNSRRAGEWAALQKDAYQRQYLDRNHVFNHPLNILPLVKTPVPVATEIRSKKQYISLPALWRNYYDIVGYHRDARSKALWLKPIVLPEMNGRMTEALYASPDGYGTVSVTTSGPHGQDKELLFKPDAPVEVRTLHLADDFGDDVSVTVNGRKLPVRRTGSGYAKELAVDWHGTVDTSGLKVTVSGSPGAAPPPPPAKSTRPAPVDSKSLARIDPYKPVQASKAGKSAGTSVEVDTTGRSYVSSINNFDWLQFSRVDFGAGGATSFTATVMGAVPGAGIEIVLDDVAGYAIGSLVVPAGADGKAWTTVSTPVKRVTGVHNVFLRFHGSSQDSLMNLDRVSFGAAPAAAGGGATGR
ncbi:carbohydrate-binding protein [Pseudoduganella sp. SL102]|uniref:carbohydrate-binding protein n=1 Tax=Pseudoduganella sp. SL102 TaxID=2995154 RepID=UPI00248CC381|nr:carbohydrate-binding protein [Pseudoduganella sp. SL102]WBR99928.1 carbohydrate-binding protein [Pseudoduganella sp. SL102]